VIAGPSSQGESQIRTTPDVNRLFAVWNAVADAMINTMFSWQVPETCTPVDSDSGRDSAPQRTAWNGFVFVEKR
jgi:hypothetical protein